MSWGDAVQFSQGNGRSHISQFVDWSARRHGVFYVTAWPNEGQLGQFGDTPSDNYNGMTVAASEYNDDTNYYDLFATTNATPDSSSPRVNIDILAPGDPVDVLSTGDFPLMMSATSYATPHVTGAVALIYQYQHKRLDEGGFGASGFVDPIRHFTIKAILMNSADKLAGIHGSQRTVTNIIGQTWTESAAHNNPHLPLDYGMGVGHLNVRRAIEQFSPGSRGPTVGDIVNPVPMIGWDQRSIFPHEMREYPLAEPLAAGQYIAITLAWDRRVEHSGGPSYTYSDTFFPYDDPYTRMNDLNLYLMTMDDTIVAQSNSTLYNVEHIFHQIENGGEYKIVVHHTGFGLGVGDEYGLAWWYGTPFSPAPGDFNGDGSVNAADYVWWRKNDGTPQRYDEWRMSFGSMSGSSKVAQSVPEPRAVSLALSILAFAVGARRHRCKARGTGTQ